MQRSLFTVIGTILLAAMIIIRIWVPAGTDTVLQLYSHAAEIKSDVQPLNFKHVLILNSYDEGYRWTMEQSTTISKRLKE
ncbi:MAG: hypothetical protein PHC91_07750, partial [Eubacteriales bacterium]|nr:hypothetical protein [Eubacteriales bacterium]